MGIFELQQAAAGLGLTFLHLGGGHSPVAAGMIDGVPVTAGHTPGGSDATHEWAIAAIFPPLDLGLDLRDEEGPIEKKLWDLFRREEIELGDEEFDRAVRVLGDEPDRVRALLTWPVRSALLALNDTAPGFHVRDASVTGHHLSVLASLPWPRAIGAAVRTATVLRAAAANIPPARRLGPWVEPTTTYAKSFGLAFATTPLSAWGDVGGLEMGLFFRRLEQGGYGLDVGTVIDASMAFDLEIAPREPKLDVPDVLLPLPRPHMRTVTLGDPGVDRRFVLTTSRPLEALPDSLPGRTRLTMARLSTSFDVTLRYGVLSLRRRLDTFTPKELPTVIDAAIEGARTLVPALRQGYRDAAR